MSLDGVRVLDLTTIIAGPVCTRTLAAFGADVVKIDEPGDERPLWFPHLHIDAHRGKRHAVIDLRSDRGRDAFLGLAARADVVVENARAGVWDRLGIGYEVVAAQRPSIVWTSVRLFSGEHLATAWPGYETTAQAVSGLAMRFGGEDGPPRRAGGGAIDDCAAGLAAAFATVVALLDARRSGVGRRVEASLVSAATLFQCLDIVRLADPGRAAAAAGDPLDTVGGIEATGPSIECRLWPAIDGRVQAVLRDGALERFAGRLGVAVDAESIAAACASQRVDALIALASASGGVAVRALDDEALRDHLEARGRFRWSDQPAWGRVGHVGLPISCTPPLGDPWKPAPGWGAHTAEVLAEADRGE